MKIENVLSPIITYFEDDFEKNGTYVDFTKRHMRCIKNYLIIALLFVAMAASLQFKAVSEENSQEIQILWVDYLDGDFSFKDNWSFPEGVFINEFGQLSCDGIFPSEIDNMFDEDRRILADSMEAFYQLVDTTHLYHSIESEAMTYEWSGTDFIKAKRIHKDTVICYTMCNAGTHSSLGLVITGNTVRATIELNSITPSGIEIFYCFAGEMIIDKNFWEQGIIKASFDFKFDEGNSDMQMYWKGKINVEIEESMSEYEINNP